ncbi:MAG: Flp pilus assembly protein CpaB, partial [Firmicutes bacterium]|nr:Flp pilus assembly protein CpaB [Bacillota bacterium]
MAIARNVQGFFRMNRWLILGLILLAAAIALSAHYIRTAVVKQVVHTTTAATVSVAVISTAVPAYTALSPADIVVKRFPSDDVPVG